MTPLRIKAIDYAELMASETPKKSKFGNKKTELDGMVFDSKGEADHYSELKLLERSGQIQNLRLQVAYELRGMNGATICKYIADFEYIEKGQMVVEDFKGMATAVYKLKAKLFKDNFPDIQFREVRSC